MRSTPAPSVDSVDEAELSFPDLLAALASEGPSPPAPARPRGDDVLMFYIGALMALLIFASIRGCAAPAVRKPACESSLVQSQCLADFA